jgi:hypothetical protein
MNENQIEPEPEEVEAAYRSASNVIGLATGAAAVAAPFVAPYVHDLIDKVTGPDDKPHVILPPGTPDPREDD